MSESIKLSETSCLLLKRLTKQKYNGMEMVFSLTAVFSCSFLDVSAPINKVRTIPSTEITPP